SALPLWNGALENGASESQLQSLRRQYPPKWDSHPMAPPKHTITVLENNIEGASRNQLVGTFWVDVAINDDSKALLALEKRGYVFSVDLLTQSIKHKYSEITWHTHPFTEHQKTSDGTVPVTLGWHFGYRVA